MSRRRTTRLAARHALGALVWVAAGNCIAILSAYASKSSAAADRAAAFVSAIPLTPADWPARSAERLVPLIEPTPKTIAMVLHRTGGSVDPDVPDEMEVQFGTISHCARYGQGLIRVIEPACVIEPVTPERQPHPGTGLPWEADQSGMRFVSRRPPDQEFVGPPVPTDAQRRAAAAPPSQASPGALADPVSILKEGTYMHLLEARGQPARGLVVHLSSLGGWTYEDAVIDRLRDQGWAVLRLTPEHFQVGGMQFSAEPVEDDDGVRAMAATIDNLLAEKAYAVEAGVEYLKANRPDVSAGPIVVMGYSAGALAAPAVAARLGDRVGAMVLIGGGANVADVFFRSELLGVDRSFEPMWPSEEPWAVRRRQLTAQYLKYARLDPYRIAPLLAKTPVLLLHARFDTIVPASCGELLYQRLGRPERWSFPFGHLLLFWRLPSQDEAIVQWVDHASSMAPSALEPETATKVP
jgi:dienelactone hydrolase